MMLELGKPGEMHKILASMEGTYSAVAKMWMKPGEDPVDVGERLKNAFSTHRSSLPVARLRGCA